MNTHKLFVDDVRPAPDGDWVLASTYAEAITLLDAREWDEVSLDYSLDRGMTGGDIIAHMATSRWPTKVSLHSGSYDGNLLMSYLINDATPNGGGPEVEIAA